MKMPAKGLYMRSAGGGEVWTAPSRDVVHCFLANTGKSVQLLRGYMNTNPVFVELLAGMDAREVEGMLDSFVSSLATFADIAANRKEKIDVTSAAREAGLLGGDPRFRAAIGHAFLTIMLSAYFAGVRQMAFAGHSPFTENSMDDVAQAAALFKAESEGQDAR